MMDTLKSLFLRLGSDAYDLPAVFVELILIGLCVNWLAGVLHGTRGTRPLRGVLIILVVATMIVRVLVASQGWVRLDLLYNYVLYGLAFIGLVVFQPELRRAVIRVGDVRFQRGGTPQSQLVSALVKSAGFLSRNRYGALIAIQRGVDLTGWAENGTLMRAEVTANLLNTIFFPNSPLHDLGVIIRGNRLLAANCQFPSAESDEVDSALGSRHLAALGMSYETDALVLVISEETGVVSLADNGKLTRYLSLDDLSEELTSRLAGRVASPETKERGLGSTVWRRVRRALVVVPLTLVIWYLADQATLAEETFQVELKLRPENPKYIVDVVSPDPLMVTARFSGSVRAIDELRDLSGGPLTARWTLPSSYRPRPSPYVIGPDELRMVIGASHDIGEHGVAVLNVFENVRLMVDEKVELTVRVHPDGGSTQIAVDRVEPPEVTAVVRQSVLDELPPEDRRVVLAPLAERLVGIPPEETRTFEHVRLGSEVGPVVVESLEPREVLVVARVVGRTKRVTNVVVELLVAPEVAERFRVEKADFNEWLIEVEVQGEKTVVDGVTAVDIEALARVTTDMVPPPGQVLADPLRTVPVIIVPKVRGVTVVGERDVRVNLVPRESSGT